MSKKQVPDIKWECDHFTYPENYSMYHGPQPVRCAAVGYALPKNTPTGWTERVERAGPCGLTNYYTNETMQYCPVHSNSEPFNG